MHSVGAAVIHLDQRVPSNFVLHPQTPELSLRDVDVRIGRAQLSRRKRERCTRACERAGITIRNSDAEILQDRVVGNILDDIERHVSKVAFVADAETATDAGLAIAPGIKGKSNPRCDCSPIRRSQLPDGAAWSDENLAVPYLVEIGRTRTEIEVERRINERRIKQSQRLTLYDREWCRTTGRKSAIRKTTLRKSL